MGTQLLLFASPPPATPVIEQSPPKTLDLHAQQAPAASEATIASGEKAKARDIITAIRTLQQIEHDHRPATPEECKLLLRFSGFGPVALSIFPNPVTGRYKDASWQALGEELRSLLTDGEYASAKRTIPNAFYTSSTVIKAMYQGLKRLGVPDAGLVLEPGCGPGRFLYLAPREMRFIGVELDSISGRIARALHPQADIRIQNFRDARLPEIDGVIGNVPFDDLKLEHKGQKFSLHDYFIAKSVDALRPGGVLAVVTSHFTLDKQNASIREYLAERADFVGAIRLPSNAFTREGTHVVTDILFLRKRATGEPAHHADPSWLETAPLDIDGTEVPVNCYFHNHPEMVLGEWSLEDTLYGEGCSVISNGDLAEQLREAIGRLPEYAPFQPSPIQEAKAPAFTPPRCRTSAKAASSSPRTAPSGNSWTARVSPSTMAARNSLPSAI